MRFLRRGVETDWGSGVLRHDLMAGCGWCTMRYPFMSEALGGWVCMSESGASMLSDKYVQLLCYLTPSRVKQYLFEKSSNRQVETKSTFLAGSRRPTRKMWAFLFRPFTLLPGREHR